MDSIPMNGDEVLKKDKALLKINIREIDACIKQQEEAIKGMIIGLDTLKRRKEQIERLR